MYYSLRKNYCLRGWKGATCALLDKSQNTVKFIDKAKFHILLLCDGESEFSPADLGDNEQAILKEFLDDGTVIAADEPAPLSDDQYYVYYNNRYVSSVFWSITGRCNYHCRHCYMDAPDGMLGEVSHEQAMNFIDQMAECGVPSVDITGGEPFVRADFWEIIDRIRSYGMRVNQVYTNGWLLNESVLDAFDARGMKPEFSISFDGVGWHDWMRGVPGAEQKALDALKLCISRGFPVNVEMCVFKGNADTVRDTVNCLAEIGVPALKCGAVSDTPLWRENCEDNRYTSYEYVEDMLKYIPQFYEDGMPLDFLIGGVAYLHRKSLKYEIVSEKYDGTDKCLEHRLCGAARSSCYITPEGRLLPCMPMTSWSGQNSFPRVQDISLRAGLSDSFYMKFVNTCVGELFDQNEECGSCEYRLKCGGGCRASAVDTTGELMGCDRHECGMWREGYVDKIREVITESIARYSAK